MVGCTDAILSTISACGWDVDWLQACGTSEVLLLAEGYQTGMATCLLSG